MNQPVNAIINKQDALSSFCHLHVHTEYSLLDGMSHPLELCQKAKDMGMNALAITDHGAMYGVIKFYQAAKKAGVKPILGCEFYVTPSGINDREKKAYHLTLLAKNKHGYKNLIKLATIAQIDGFYYNPRIDHELLQKYATGLVAMSGCLAGEVPQLLKDNKLQKAKESALWHKNTFEDYYLELQLHPIPELQEVNFKLIQLSQELNIPLVATNDLHYVNREDAEFQDLLLCVGTGKIVTDTNRMRMDGNHYYLTSPQEMAAKYIEYPQALIATQEIADKCNLELDFGSVDLPSIPLPEGYTAISYLRELALQGLAKHYSDASVEVLKRFEYEMDVIDKTKFADYFLVTWDIIRFAKENNIKYGIRGSAASSIVLRCLEITSIDPIKYQLVFERFLNIERQEMPDIDMDFEDKRRGDVINYVSEKYGHDHVAQIVTFGTLGAKQAIRDTARVLNISLPDADKVAKLIPDRGGSLRDFMAAVNKPNSPDNHEILALHKELLEEYNNSSLSRDLIQKATHLEGVARHAGVHAAGVVIAAKPLSET
ncbi:MAG: DNA polymerase III subunit alpha, partial [Chloroflexi bacterium]|nr:DNA polymerase III subunit alpha [Chloroflexota bacterium]